MRRTILGAALLCALSGSASAATSPGEARGLCTPAEKVYFACPTTKERWISVCGGEGGAPQYRFGRVGAKAELSYPAQPAEASKKLFFSHYARYQKDRTEVRFDNDGVSYVVFDDEEGRRRSAGIMVTDAKGRETNLLCKGTPVSRLPQLGGVIACDRESALNGGQCP